MCSALWSVNDKINVFETVQQLKKVKLKNELASYKKNARTTASQNKKMTRLIRRYIYMFTFFLFLFLFLLFPCFFFLLSDDICFQEKDFLSLFTFNNKRRHDASVTDVYHLPSHFVKYDFIIFYTFDKTNYFYKKREKNRFIRVDQP